MLLGFALVQHFAAEPFARRWTTRTTNRHSGCSNFDPPKREIRIRLNAAHPGIRAAALSLDHEALNCYVAEMCLLGIGQVQVESGDYPWPHSDWPEFLAACDSLGRNIRSLGKVQ